MGSQDGEGGGETGGVEGEEGGVAGGDEEGGCEEAGRDGTVVLFKRAMPVRMGGVGLCDNAALLSGVNIRKFLFRF